METSGLSKARFAGKGTLWRIQSRQRQRGPIFLDRFSGSAFDPFAVHDFRPVSHNGSAYLETVQLRDRILRAPLGLVFSEEERAAEAEDFHLAGFDPGSEDLVACLVLTPLDDETLKMRQVAVTETHRGRGIGKALVSFAEGFAREQGFARLVLHAREPVVPFYEALGYAIVGPPFVEVTLPHRRLSKKLGG